MALKTGNSQNSRSNSAVMGTVNANPASLEFAYWTAGSNWCLWRADFEWNGHRAKLPVLQNSKRFLRFTSDYNLFMYKDAKVREKVRKFLYCNVIFKAALRDKRGTGIDGLTQCLRRKFPGHGIGTSLVSKLAAFAAPKKFVASDKFARIGASRLQTQKRSPNYPNYAAYLKDVHSLRGGQLGTDIRDFVNRWGIPSKDQDAFELRVLDVYLMIIGGRWN